MKVNPYRFDWDFSFEDSLPLETESRRIVDRAKRGLLQDLRDLGCSYIHAEDGFPHDPKRARYWYAQAGNQGHAEAMWDLAMMWMCGEGGEKDHDQSLSLLKPLASRKRWDLYVDDAAKLLAEIYRGKIQIDVVPNETEAEHWEELATVQKATLPWLEAKTKVEVSGVR